MNTRNDENDLTLKQFIAAYEKEMDLLVDESNNIISKYKVQLDKSNKQDELEAEVKKITDEVQRQKDQSKKEFGFLKQKVDEREKKLSQDYETKLILQKQEYENLKQKYAILCTNLENLDSKLDQQNEVHKQEMDNFIREHNSKYNKLLQEKLDLEDQLKSSEASERRLRQELEMLRKQYQEDIERIKASNSRTMSEMIDGYENKIRILNAEIKDLKDQLSGMGRDKTAEEDRLRKLLEEERKKYEEIIADLRKQVADLKAELDRLNTAYHRLRKELEEKDAELRKALALIAELNKKIELLQGNNSDLLSNWQEEKIKLLAEKDNLEIEIKKLRETVVTMDKDIQKINKDLYEKSNMYDSLSVRHKEDTERYLGQIAKLEDELEKLRQKYRQLSEEYADFKRNSSGDATELQKKIEQLLEQIAMMKRNHSDEVDSLKKFHESDIREIAQKHRQDLEDMENRYTRKIDDLTSQHNKCKKIFG